MCKALSVRRYLQMSRRDNCNPLRAVVVTSPTDLPAGSQHHDPGDTVVQTLPEWGSPHAELHKEAVNKIR